MNFDSNPNKEKLLQYPFAQYQRYRLTSDLILQFKEKRSIKKMRIIDIGASVGAHLKFFLPSDDIFFFNLSYPSKVQDDPHFIEGDALQMPLNDEAFDLVVSLDVYEHIPSQKREDFVKELYRVGKYGCVLGAPFEKNNIQFLEELANEHYKIIYGKDNIWLKEHIDNKLPVLEETLTILNKLSKYIQIFPNGYLPHWQFMINLQMTFDSSAKASKYLTLINRFYNQNFYDFDNQEPCYRYLLAVLKSECTLHLSSLSESFDLDSNKEKLQQMVNDLKENVILNENRRIQQRYDQLKLEYHQLQQSKAVLISKRLAEYPFLLKLTLKGFNFLARIYQLSKKG